MTHTITIDLFLQFTAKFTTSRAEKSNNIYTQPGIDTITPVFKGRPLNGFKKSLKPQAIPT